MTKAQKAEQAEFIAKLRAEIKPGDTLFTVLKNVSKSGMSRKVNVYKIQDNEPRWLAYWVSKATGIPFDERTESLRVDGCGTDAGFELVYTLGRVLFPNGFAVVNEDGTPKRGRNGDMSGWDNDGGYALNQRWM